MKTFPFRTDHLTRTLCLLTTFAVAGSTVLSAAETDPEDPTTEERLVQQEQRIRELEDRIMRLEAALMSGNFTHSGPTAEAAGAPVVAETPPTRAPSGGASPEGAPAVVAEAAEPVPVEEIPARIDESSGEFRETQHVVTGASLASDTFPGSWPMFGSEFRMKIGGYLKVDALYDFDGTSDENQFIIAGIPVEGSPEAGRDGYFNMHLKETRYNFDIRNSSSGSAAQKFFLEMDFFGANSSTPRLRHAYVQYGNLIVGQTWSTVTELRAINYMIDFAFGDAIYGTRSKQIRWQQQIDQQWSWAVGLEKLDLPGIYSQGLGGLASSRLPLLAGRVTFENKQTILMLGATVNELRWDGEGVGPDATATAWALVLDGRKNLGDNDYFTAGLTFSEGAAEGMAAVAGRNVNAVLFPDGSLETNSHWNVSLGYTHKWNDKFSTNLNYAQFELDSNNKLPADSMESGWIAHVNFIWKVTPRVLTGLEYMWGERENTNGDKGNASRAQTMLMYNF